MAEVITRQELEEAKLDADSIAKFVNGGETETVTTRTGATYPTAANIVKNVASNVIGALSISQGVYGSTAEGITATTSGTFFSVISADVNEYVILYLNNAGVAQERKRYPSYEVILAITSMLQSFTSSNPLNATAFSDELGFVLMKLLTDGSLQMRGGIITHGGNGLAIADNNGFGMARFGPNSADILGFNIEAFPKRRGIYFLDPMGFVLGKVSTSGGYMGPRKLASNSDILPPRVAKLAQQVRTAIMQIVGDGQSLSVGVTSTPAISKTQEYSNVMMTSGVKSRYNQYSYNPALVPLIEQDEVAPMPTNQGETPVTGMANGLVRRIVESGQPHTDWCFAAMAAGRSGWAVEQLSPAPLGTAGVWEDMVNMIKDMKAQADNAGKTYSVWAYQWVQGESNYKEEYVHNQYQYTQYLAQLWDKFTVEVLKITGQEFQPYMFTYQVAGHRKYSRDWMDIALSQWALSKNRPDVVMAVPCYQFKPSADNLHLTNEQSWLMGEYFGRAMHYTMVRKCGKWRPLEPVSVNWQGDTIDIKYHVPGGKIVIDTALCTQARNQGFDIRDVSDAIVPSAIQSVAVTGFDTVQIKLAAEAVGASFRVTYARGAPGDPGDSGSQTGARGNVRDSMGDFDKVTSPLGNTFDMHNACVMFQFDKKNGFL